MLTKCPAHPIGSASLSAVLPVSFQHVDTEKFITETVGHMSNWDMASSDYQDRHEKHY
jgi:hypothetical protein